MVSSPRACAGLGARLLILSIVLLVSACVGVPETQLVAYTDMFGQARQAGHLIYKEMIPALEEGKTEKTAEAFSVSLGPEAFERGDCDPAFAVFASLLARCELLGTVARYNDALFALARGASTEEGRARLKEIFAGLSTVASIASLPTLFPWAPAVIEPIKAIIGQALELRDRAALKGRFAQRHRLPS